MIHLYNTYTIVFVAGSCNHIFVLVLIVYLRVQEVNGGNHLPHHVKNLEIGQIKRDGVDKVELPARHTSVDKIIHINGHQWESTQRRENASKTQGDLESVIGI